VKGALPCSSQRVQAGEVVHDLRSNAKHFAMANGHGCFGGTVPKMGHGHVIDRGVQPRSRMTQYWDGIFSQAFFRMAWSSCEKSRSITS
jgi:hypothetical protein